MFRIGKCTADVQVLHLRSLARLQVQRQQYRPAAATLQLLALRKSGPGETEVALSERLDTMSEALLQV